MTGYVLHRRPGLAAALAERGDALAVTGLGSATWDLASLGDRPENFYLWGAMGNAAMIGLGLAIAQPDRRVVVITGDGEMLMGLASLTTIGARRPANLAICVLDNERSEEHTSELQSLMRISYAVFCLKTKKKNNNITTQ